MNQSLEILTGREGAAPASIPGSTVFPAPPELAQRLTDFTPRLRSFLRLRVRYASYRAYQANLFYIGRSVGTWFNADDLPETRQLVARLWRDASWHVWALKFKYSRVRPNALDPRLQPLQETPWAAFPSGHSSFAHILAYLYAELAPEFADIFLKDARDVGHSREIIGVHFPSDTEAGRVFARQFVDRLLADPVFAAEFANVRAEWERVRAASPD